MGYSHYDFRENRNCLKVDVTQLFVWTRPSCMTYFTGEELRFSQVFERPAAHQSIRDSLFWREHTERTLCVCVRVFLIIRLTVMMNGLMCQS